MTWMSDCTCACHDHHRNGQCRWCALTHLTEAVNQLAKPRRHREPYQRHTANGTLVHDHHVTWAISLIDQLGRSIEPCSLGGGHTVPGSRPAARLEAIDTLMLIDAEVGQWIGLLGLEDRHRVVANLHALLGEAAGMEQDPQLITLSRAASRWVTQAAVMTGWEVPARTLHSTCPLCASLGTLRVRVGDGITNASAWALCVQCRETWDDSNIGLLAEHIRAENGDESLYGEAS